MSRSALAAAALIVSSCATQPKPVIHSVCVEIKEMPEHETAFMLKRTAKYLGEYHMSQATTGCDVVAKFQPFGKFQAEIVGLVKSGYWSQEGNVTVTHNGVVFLEDEQISVRGQDSRQDALDATAWQIVKPVVKSFRPTQ